jgi:hypothetical protein
MSDCSCDNINTESTSTPCVPLSVPTGCNRIRMFFGSEVPPSGQIGLQTKPGQLNKLYYTSEIDENHIRI